MNTSEVINKRFKDGSCIFYNPGDSIADEHYLTYVVTKNRTVLFIGCNEGQVPVKSFDFQDGDKLEELIKTLIYY